MPLISAAFLRPRFSMRSMLVGVTALAVGFAWLGSGVRNARLESAAIRALQVDEIYYDYQREPATNLVTLEDWAEIGWLRFNGFGEYDGYRASPMPEWIRKLFGKNFLASVVSVDVGELSNLSRLARLEELGNGFLSCT